MVLTSLASKQAVRLSPKLFAKLLYMARLQGWKPERMPENWPLTSWDTAVVLPDLGPYRQGLVSKNDARGLAGALNKLVAIEGATFQKELYSAATQIITLLGRSAFTVSEALQSPRLEPIA